MSFARKLLRADKRSEKHNTGVMSFHAIYNDIHKSHYRTSNMNTEKCEVPFLWRTAGLKKMIYADSTHDAAAITVATISDLMLGWV